MQFSSFFWVLASRPPSAKFPPWIESLVTPLNKLGTGAAQKTLMKVFILKSFWEKRFHVSLWFQWKAIMRQLHEPKFFHSCHAWISFCHARYLVNNCHVFQSGLKFSAVFKLPWYYFKKYVAIVTALHLNFYHCISICLIFRIY